MDPTRMALAEVVAACREETAKYRRGQPYRDAYCHDLLRRAVVDRDDAAWEAVHAQYRAVVITWVRQHPASAGAREELEYYAERAFQRFWGAIGPARFAQFSDSASLLKYLKMCVHSVLVDEARAAAAQAADPLVDELDEPAPGPGVEAEALERLTGRDLWRAIEQELPDEAERLVVRLSCALDMKPGEVHARHPERFESVADVYRIKRNALDRLRRSPLMQTFRENAPPARSLGAR